VDIQQEVRVGRSNCAFKALVLDPEKGLLEGNKPLRHSGDILRISSKAKVREQEELSLKEFAILEERDEGRYVVVGSASQSIMAFMLSRCVRRLTASFFKNSEAETHVEEPRS